MPGARLTTKQYSTLSARKRTSTGASVSSTGGNDTGTSSPSKSGAKLASESRKLRQKTCPACREKFTPVRPLQIACKWECAIAHTANLKAKRERKETRERKAAAKPRSKWMTEAQAAFNRWVRLRDADRPCISCGTTTAGKWDAGHYRSVGSNPALRFEPLNNHKQCVPCNQHKSGNAIEYRIGLVARIGREAVEWLEGPHEPKHYTIEDLREIKRMYAAKAKELVKREQ